MILKSAIIGDFTSWTHDIVSFFAYALFGMVLMFIFANKLIDKVFLPNTVTAEHLKNNNISAIAIVAGVKFAIAIIISGVIL